MDELDLASILAEADNLELEEVSSDDEIDLNDILLEQTQTTPQTTV